MEWGKATAQGTGSQQALPVTLSLAWAPAQPAVLLPPKPQAAAPVLGLYGCGKETAALPWEDTNCEDQAPLSLPSLPATCCLE